MNVKQLAVLTAVVLTMAGARAEHIKYSQLPQQVQQSLNAQGGAGAVKDIEQSTENGRTIYKVHLQKEGRDRHLKLSESGQLLDDNSRGARMDRGRADADADLRVGDKGVRASADVDVDREAETPRKKGIFSKSDGKILALFPAPSAKKNKAEVRTEIDTQDGVSVETDADLDRDNDVFKKGDGKVLGVDVDRDNDGVKVEGDVDIDKDNDAFRKGDGKVLGVDVDRDNDGVKVEGDVDVDDDDRIFKKGDGKVLGVDVDRDNDGVKVEGDVDVDDNDRIFQKGDGKVLGVDVDRDNDGVKVEGDVDVDDDDRIFKKGDGKILGVDVDRDDDGVKVEGDVDVDNDNDVFKKGDGKILGVDVDRDNDGVKVEGDVDVDTDRDTVVKETAPATQNRVTTDAEGGLDTDKNDNRILGVPKRGFSTLQMSQVPDPVQKTIRMHARGARVAEIELADHNGMQVYEVDIERDGKNQELHIAADGRLMKDTDRGVGAPAPGESGTRTRINVEDDKIEIKKD